MTELDETLWTTPDGAEMGEEDVSQLDLMPSEGEFGSEAGSGLLDYGTPGSVSNPAAMPYAPTCHISSRPKAGVDLGAPGSGFFWGAGVLITAAHNLYDIGTKKWFAELEIGPGRNGNSWPFGRLKVPLVNGSVVVLKRWVDTVNAGNPDRNVDFGLVRLGAAQVTKPPPGMYAIASRSGGISGLRFLLPGYTMQPPGNGYMSQGKGAAGNRTGTAMVFHDAPAGRGASGAPLIVLDPKGNPGNVVYAMHIAEDPSARKNVALEFTDSIRNTISTWATASRVQGEWLLDPPLD
jgi:V8-like Glu-specific endopeptidase